jgi:hypothetical protein
MKNKLLLIYQYQLVHKLFYLEARKLRINKTFWIFPQIFQLHRFISLILFVMFIGINMTIFSSFEDINMVKGL